MAAKYPDSIHVTDATDYDFYCSNCPEHIEILDECGFNKVHAPDRSYWDSQLLEMYKHSDFALEVLIRKDVNFYRRAFESISADDFIRYVWKSAPRNRGKEDFREGICKYFNDLFYSLKKELSDEIPF